MLLKFNFYFISLENINMFAFVQKEKNIHAGQNDHHCLRQNVHTCRRFTPWFCQLVSCPSLVRLVRLKKKHRNKISIEWTKSNALKFCYKYINDELPSYFCHFQLTRQGSGHSYDTRQGDQIRTTRTRINFVDHCLRNHLPSLINSTPPNIMSKITTHSLHGFSICLIKKLFRAIPKIVKLQTAIFVTDLEKTLVNKKYFILMIGLYLCLCKSSDQV